MRRFRSIWIAFAASVMLVSGAGSAVATAAPTLAVNQATSAINASPQHSPLPPFPPHPPAPPTCPATGITGAPTDMPPVQLEPYFLGDWRLGPAKLPTTGPVDELLQGYQRTDALTPGQFLDCYWDETADNGRGGWRYPPNGGFAGDPSTVTIQAGQYLDRFGPNTGRFLSPLGADFAERALPPSSLNTFELRYPNDYHVFRVLKTFQADGGPAAPWFGQSGGAIQYRLDDSYFPGEVVPPEHANVQWLIDHQYLAPLN